MFETHRQEESPRVVRTLFPAVALFGKIASETSRAAESSAGSPSHRIELGGNKVGGDLGDEVSSRRKSQGCSDIDSRCGAFRLNSLRDIESGREFGRGAFLYSPSHRIELG